MPNWLWGGVFRSRGLAERANGLVGCYPRWCTGVVERFPEVLVREAVDEELEEISSLRARTLLACRRRQPEVFAHLHSLRKHPKTVDCLVVLMRGVIVGTADIFPRGRDYYVGNVVVREGFRRSGIGRAIMSFVQESATKNDRYRTFLHVGRENTGAIELYKAVGFQPHCDQTMRIPTIPDPPSDHILFVKHHISPIHADGQAKVPHRESSAGP